MPNESARSMCPVRRKVKKDFLFPNHHQLAPGDILDHVRVRTQAGERSLQLPVLLALCGYASVEFLYLAAKQVVLHKALIA